MTVVKRIIRYVNGTSDYGIWYSRDLNDCLAGYSNVDWAECVDDRKSTSGGCFYLKNNLVPLISKKKNSMSLSIAKAEYIAASSCFAQLLWMKSFFMIIGSLKTPCASSVTTLVPLIYPRTLFNTQSQNISKFNIISFETW